MALYIQLSTQNVLTKFLSVSSITGGNSVNGQQLASTVASLLTNSVIPPYISTQGIFTSTLTTSTLTSGVVSTLVLYASSIIGVNTGGLVTLPSTISTFAILTSSLQASTVIANVLSSQQLFASSLVGNSISSLSMNAGTFVGTTLFVSSATLSTFSTNNINFAGGFGYLTMPDIYPNTVFTSTVTASNLLVGWNSVVSPIQFFGSGNYTNSVVAELSTGATTQELMLFRGSNATDRIRMQTTGSIVFEPGVSARLWPTVPSNVTPAMVINTSSNVGIQTASPAFPLDVAGTGRFITLSSQQVFTSSIQAQSMSTLNLNVSTINGQVFGAPINSTVIGLASAGYISTSQLVSTVAGLGSGFTGSTTSLSAATIFVSSLRAVTLSSQQLFTGLAIETSTVTSSLLVNGTGIVKWNGTNSASLYGAGVDTLTLQGNAAYTGAIASLAFAANTSSYPLARVYAIDSAISGSPISQLIFQTVPVLATTFTSNYAYTGSNQTFTVPSGVTSVQLTMWGAGGGNSGGAGAFVQGVLTVSPGQVYTIVVGGGGGSSFPGAASATFGGGGSGGGSGGGRSAIQLTLTNSITTASGSGSLVTYTTNTNISVQSGQPVVITGLSPSGYSGSFIVANVLSSTQFTVVNGTTGTSSGTGTLYIEVADVGGGGGGAGGNGGAATFSGTALTGGYSSDYRIPIAGTGGTQSGGGTGSSSGSALIGGDGTSSGYGTGGGGGGGYYGGGGGQAYYSGPYAAGGGGSSYTSFSGFALTLGLNSPNLLNQAPGTAVSGYVTGVAAGGGTGGNGYIIVNSIGGSITEAMRIGSNSYVGIGTTSPSYQLDVAGSARMSNVYLGTNSTLITQQFYGLFGNYNNTVLAEISTGGGAQELLVFKGSSTSDRVRVQTTGTFVVETGVSARLWSTNTAITASNVTPAFIVTTSSNVGIQTASPGATLDVAGTGRFQQLSTLNLNVSTINGQVFGAPINSTVIGLASAGYISTSQLVSTVAGLASGGGLSATQLTSTVQGLGTVGYLSTIPIRVSTSQLLTSSLTASTIVTSSLQVDSLTIGTGTGWLNLGPLQTVAISSIQANTNALYANTSFFGNTSTATMLEYFGLFGNYNNTVLAEVSTGGGTQEFLVFKGSSASDRVRVQTTGTFVVETGVSARLWNDNTTATLSNVTPAFIINSSSNVGIQTNNPGATLDVAGTGRFQQVSTLNLNVSTINGQTFGAPINSTVIGLASAGYISTSQLVSTVAGIGSGGGSAFTGSTNSLSAGTISVSSMTGVYAQFQTLSTFILNASTVTAPIITASTVATNALSLATNPSWILTSPLQTLAVSTNTVWADQSYVNSGTVTTGTFSTMTTNALTLGIGATWIQTAPIQTSVVSSIFLFANQPFFDTVNVGSVSTMNSLEYSGLFGNYNNTVLAEISTGGGTQEFLVFKGSSASDRVRVQTTGTFVVETGVSARLFNSNTTQTLSNVTPAFIVNSSSNVGIQTATPGATLDVAGSGRFQSLSSLAIFASSIVAPYVFAPQFFTF